MLPIVEKYINPKIYESYINKRQKEFEKLLKEREEIVSKPKFKDLLDRMIDNIFISQNRVNRKLLK